MILLERMAMFGGHAAKLYVAKLLEASVGIGFAGMWRAAQSPRRLRESDQAFRRGTVDRLEGGPGKPCAGGGPESAAEVIGSAGGHSSRRPARP